MAIARDITSSGSASGATSVTVAHTCTGNNVILLAFCYNEGGETSLSCTYNGNAMTQLSRLNNSGNGTFEYVYGILIGTGDASAHNIVFGSSGNATRSIVACSYTGVIQSITMDSVPTAQASTTTTLTTTFTTVANNAWIFGGGYASNGTYNSSTNTTTVVKSVAPNSHVGAVDGGPVTPAGTFNASVANSGGSGLISFTGVSFAPARTIKKIAGIWKTAASGSSAGLLTNLVSYWKLNESSGNAADSVGGNTLTNNNTVGYSAGEINNGADFIAANSESLTIADASQTGLDITGDISMSCWLKMTSQPANDSQMCLAGKWLSAGNQRSYYFVYQSTGATKNLYFEYCSDGGSTGTWGHVNTTLTNGVWYHIAMTVNVAAKTATIYVNGTGTAATIDGASATSIFNGSSDFAIGKLGGNSSYYLDGSIDEVGIWSRALTSTEVALLYNGGTGMDYPFRSIKKISGISKP